ncbi:MAG: AAA family ATPase [Patescibacteria group bacterium]|nr:AAA family ATPase [Patescibacteria group bacterium]
MKILKLEAKNIRGIKRLLIEPNGQNIVIFGPNGTGKSAIVDAIDFLLTGNIARLAGEGAKSLSLKEHGCHVDSRKDLKNAIVAASVQVAGKKLDIERCINKPSVLKVIPEKERDFVESYLAVAKLGQCVLSRREILQYITAEAGKRAKQIMSLLNLSDIERLRATLVTARNKADTNYKSAESSLVIEKTDILTTLSISDFSEEQILKKVNELRDTLGAAPVSTLSPTNLKDGIKIYLVGASNDVLSTQQIEALIDQGKRVVGEKDSISERLSELRGLLSEIQKEGKISQYHLYKRLFESGISLLGGANECPLCGRAWEDGDLKVFLQARSKQLEISQTKEAKIADISLEIKKWVDLYKHVLDSLEKATKQLSPERENSDLQEMIAKLADWSEAMNTPIESFETSQWPTIDLPTVVKSIEFEIKVIAPIEAALEVKGKLISKQQLAWDTLTTLEGQWRKYERALETRNKKALFKARAAAILEYFQESRDQVLERIYNAVKSNFDTYHKSIHPDEAGFTSKLSHVEAELILEVDFFDRGMFPPHALHSEGHQDSMGLCLFLALNKYLTRDRIDMIILDDVVMSIDRGHRRATCSMLKSYFPDKQFIITTHETAWARQLKTEKIVSQKNMLHFINWNVDVGPVCEMEKDLWGNIKDCLAKDNVPEAASQLRRNAECFFENVCDLTGASLPYRGNHQWTLGDFASAAVSAYKRSIRQAKAKLRGKGLEEKLKKLTEIEAKANTVIDKSLVEQWAINANVHYNKWVESSREEFEPVVESFKDLFDLFMCNKCGTTLSMSENRSTQKKVISCECGELSWSY